MEKANVEAVLMEDSFRSPPAKEATLCRMACVGGLLYSKAEKASNSVTKSRSLLNNLSTRMSVDLKYITVLYAFYLIKKLSLL